MTSYNLESAFSEWAAVERGLTSRTSTGLEATRRSSAEPPTLESEKWQHYIFPLISAKDILENIAYCGIHCTFFVNVSEQNSGGQNDVET